MNDAAILLYPKEIVRCNIVDRLARAIYAIKWEKIRVLLNVKRTFARCNLQLNVRVEVIGHRNQTDFVARR